MTPLATALPAMTLLQVTVALGLFAISVLAPQLGLSFAELGAINTLLFVVGALSAAASGELVRRLGDLPTAAACALCVALAMLAAAAGGWGFWIAALLIGLAFGPETPASTSVLSRLCPPERRTLVFSIRQTGNQIGAMTGSLLLPWLWTVQPSLPFLVVAAVAGASALLFARLQRRPAFAGPVGVARPGRQALQRIVRTPALLALAIAILFYTALQMCVNAFLMSHAVQVLALDVPTAAGAVATAQGLGLVGRLFWGWTGRRPGASAPLLVMLGIAMGLAAAAIGLLDAKSPHWAVYLVAALLGFTASGWNGVFVAEAARLAPPDEPAAMTGGLLLFGYGGLAVAPALFAGLTALVGSAAAFALLGAACVGAALLLALRLRQAPGEAGTIDA